MKNMPGNQPAGPDVQVVERVRRGLCDAARDRRSKDEANHVLDRVGAEEELVRRANALADARRMRDAIALVLGLLGELDDLMPDERDRSAFHEIADLFRDVADFAAHGGASAIAAARQGRT